ncbi:MAG: restriction endonuclease subunit S [Methanoregula sp.]
MPSEWKTMQLQDFVTLQRGHDLTESDRMPGNIPVYGSFGMSGYHNAAKAKGPGVTVGRSGGSFGVVNYCPVDFWPHNTALYVIDFHGNDEKFAYYYLKNLDFTRYNSGSAQASLNRNYIHPMEVKIPSLPTQHAIARILGSLDDKIELNRQMNETLEAMARAIFQSWFVDFDPVRAKADGRDTGLPADIAALFPDGFEEIDGREVPRGWGVGTVGESTTIVGGSTPSTINSEYWEDGTHNFATPKDLASLSTPILLDTEKKITDQGVNQISSRILPLGTLLLSSRAPIGYTAIATVPVSINQGFIAIICDKKLPNFYLLMWVNENMQSIIDRANGTTFLEISKSNFKPMEILIPSKEILNRFAALVKPLYSQIENNEQQSRTLAQTRDALLPKLMSGEVQVPIP